MKKEVMGKVLAFMKSKDTSGISSNEFIWDFIEHESGFEYKSGITMTRDLFCKIVSVESILRSRRKIIADHGIGIRTKADTEEEYIEEFGRKTVY